MKKSNLFYAAMATVALTACSGEDIYLVQGPGQNPDKTDSIPIVFTSEANGVTRANLIGADAADKLGGKFVVFGYKGALTGEPGSTVFDNYSVEYAENTAYTSESNVANWEYVGKTLIKHAFDNGITRQTIKYWDYSQDQYDFIAWSTGEKEPIYEEPTTGVPGGSVLVSAIEATKATTPATGLAKGYTMTGAAEDLAACYIADIVTVKKGEYADETADYPHRVPITFRSLGTKVRIGIYETVPGYSVKNVTFYSAAASNDAGATPKLFSTFANGIYTYGTYTISFPTVDTPASADNNQAHVAFDGGTAEQSTVVQWGNLNYTIREEGEKSAEAIYLGRSSNTATYAGDAAKNYYTYYLPNEDGVNLNLRVNFTLESIDGSGEVINVKGATAQVPSIYTQWQPGYAYTYLFKISDKTNGHTGGYDPTQPDNTSVNSDPAGLYPITFDAVVVNAEDGDKTQETITTISTPSITTYQKGSNVVNNNEYTTGNPIYVTVNDGTKETTPDLANGDLQALTDKAALYTLEAGHTEAEVVDALSMRDDDAATNTIKGRSKLVLTKADFDLVNSVEFGVDGNAISVETDQALKFTPTSGTTYAFVYTKKAATAANDKTKYEALNFGDFESDQTKYRYGFKAARKAGSADGAADRNDAQKGVKYYNSNDATAALQTPFIGQGVGNLYLDAAGNTIATGYAVTGTTYYYTTDGGQSYTAAHNVAYGSPADLGLYVNNGGTYGTTTDTTPVDGTAYYYKDASDNYIYCVFLPQQTTSWYEIDTTTYVEANETTAITGMTYFDKFTQNDGVYYVKIIKVQ